MINNTRLPYTKYGIRVKQKQMDNAGAIRVEYLKTASPVPCFCEFDLLNPIQWFRAGILLHGFFEKE